MRIGIDLRCLQTSRRAGVGLYTEKLTQSLRAVGGSHDWLGYTNRWTTDTTGLPAGLPIRNYNIPSKFFNLSSLTFNRPQMGAKDKLDILWLPNWNIVPLSSAYKVVLTVHDLSFLIEPKWYDRRRNAWHKAIKLHNLLQRVDTVVAVSDQTKSDLNYFFKLPADKIHVIRSGYEVSELNNAEPPLKTPYLLYLGTVEPRKNIIGIIEAFDKLLDRQPDRRNLSLVIVGNWGWKTREINSRLESSAFRKNYVILDYLDESQKMNYLRHCRGLIWPSFYEGFSFPPLEARLFCIPVLTSYAAANPEAVGESAILVDPHNIEDIYEGLVRLLGTERGDPIQPRKWDAVAAEYLNLFESL
ncbi:MAG: glycosyltransferase family 4 protein [Candidatus Komeilibacteria bacterium]|nr:glycosyltransferase family 4 protein [Candidatus Komeilibacteria bacterium]